MYGKKDSKLESYYLEKATRGDRTGLAYLVKTYKDMAYTIAFRIVSNKEDAEEVVQDAFMKAFAALPSFRRASKFSTWLFRIVYNTAVSKVKTERRLRAIGIDEILSAHFTSDHGWDVLDDEERKKYLDLAMSRLNEEDRIIVTLYYIGDKRIAEICEITGKERSAVKMRLLRGRKQLEQWLGGVLKHEIKSLL